MKIRIEESDLKPFLSARSLTQLKNRKMMKEAGPEWSEKARSLMKALPEVIASLVRQSEPKGFQVSEFEIEVIVSGKPFGVGVESKGSVKFSRK